MKFSLRLTKARVLPGVNALEKGFVVSEVTSGSLLCGMLKPCLLARLCGIWNDLLGNLKSPLDIEKFWPKINSLMVQQGQ